MVMVGSVFGLAVLLGTRVFKLDRETAMLIGAGSAICGAAAVMATEPVVRAQAHKVSVAVATVVVFGTTGMFLYPWLYPHLGLGAHRSEEHTSELQSLMRISYAVFCLKKKITKNKHMEPD